MNSSETNKVVEEPKSNEVETQDSFPQTVSNSVKGDHIQLDDISASTDDRDSPSADAASTKEVKTQKKFRQNNPRKLYQALARVEGSLKVKDDALVLVTKDDKTELEVVKVAGEYTAVRLLKRAANRRQGIFSLYPLEKGYKIVNYMSEEKAPRGSETPSNDQMFICGQFVSRENGAFLVDIGRHKRTYKAKRKVEIPLRVEGQAADPNWQAGQWISLALQREGSRWMWQGDKRAVLKGILPFKDTTGKLSGT